MRERIITAIALLAGLLPIIFFGGNVFYVGVIAGACIATWEMVKMRETRAQAASWVKVATFAGVLLMLMMPTFNQALRWNNFIFLALLIANFIGIRKGKADISFYLLVIFYVGIAFRALWQIRDNSLMLFIFLITTVILTDSFAYFGGRLFGKKKLAPKISPNKTVEGAISGWLIGGGFAFIFGLLTGLFYDMWVLIALAAFLPPLSMMGDLVASALKRQYGIKDYSNLFPGHGGVMDRIDSQMLAAMLIYVMIMMGGVV